MSCDLDRFGAAQTLNPIHQHADGTWWWYDETWAQEYGPFRDEWEAMASLGRYVGG